MKISFSTVPGNLTTSIGYGVAGFNMVLSLQRLGHQVPFQDPNVKVQIHFSQPEWYEFHPGQYKIGYTPWESTGIPLGWKEEFNNLDELWTPSPVVAGWFRDAGVKTDIRVYEHGIDHAWQPSRRKIDDKIRFLHHGEPAPRKGGQMALDAFRAAFGDRSDVHLTIKSNGPSTVRAKDGRGSILGVPEEVYKNVTVRTQDIPEDSLIGLYRIHHCLVYPGWGEGFGLIPLQALATGMPTICPPSWAPYERFILPELRLDSTLTRSPWPHIHPGRMFKPSFDDLVDKYRYVADNYDKLAGRAYKNSFAVHNDYDWDILTKDAFQHIVEKFQD